MDRDKSLWPKSYFDRIDEEYGRMMEIARNCVERSEKLRKEEQEDFVTRARAWLMMEIF